MERIFEYAIIRLIPHAHRGEQLNIGVVVFSRSTVEVHLRASLAALRAFGLQSASIDWIPSFFHKVDDPTLPVTERHKILSLSAGYSLSELGWFSVVQDSDYDLRIEEILRDYVDRPKQMIAPKKRSSLMKELRSTFQFHDIMGRGATDLDKHKIVSNVPVGPAGKLHIDFLIRNGHYHATETIDFRRSDDAGISELKDAALASVTLRYARDHLGANSTKCYLVYAAPAVVEKSVYPAIALVEKNVDRAFNIESEVDRKSYINCMLEASGSVSLL